MERPVRPRWARDHFLFIYASALFLVLLTVLSRSAVPEVRGESTGITWENYATGMSAPDSGNRTVMVYFYEDNSQCAKMDTDTFRNGDVVEVVSEFICIKVVRTNENRDILNEYKVDHYPTVVFLDDNVETKRVVGYKSAEVFMGEISALDEEDEPAIIGFLTIFIPVIVVTFIIIIILYVLHVKKRGGK